jgi:hypothetical protein
MKHAVLAESLDPEQAEEAVKELRQHPDFLKVQEVHPQLAVDVWDLASGIGIQLEFAPEDEGKPMIQHLTTWAGGFVAGYLTGW